MPHSSLANGDYGTMAAAVMQLAAAGWRKWGTTQAGGKLEYGMLLFEVNIWMWRYGRAFRVPQKDLSGMLRRCGQLIHFFPFSDFFVF